MNVNAFSQKDYENKPPSGPKKTNPIKPNLETTPGLPKIAIAFDYNGIFVTRLGSPGIICLI